MKWLLEGINEYISILKRIENLEKNSNNINMREKLLEYTKELNRLHNELAEKLQDELVVYNHNSARKIISLLINIQRITNIDNIEKEEEKLFIYLDGNFILISWNFEKEEFEMPEEIYFEVYDSTQSFNELEPAEKPKIKPIEEAPEYMKKFVEENQDYVLVSYIDGSYHEKWAKFSVMKRTLAKELNLI